MNNLQKDREVKSHLKIVVNWFSIFFWGVILEDKPPFFWKSLFNFLGEPILIHDVLRTRHPRQMGAEDYLKP